MIIWFKPNDLVRALFFLLIMVRFDKTNTLLLQINSVCILNCD